VNYNYAISSDVPEICKRTTFCFKKQVLESYDSNNFSALGDLLDANITRSIDDFEYPYLKF
jgi:hypothetical protein